MSLQGMFDDFDFAVRSGQLSDPDPAECGCRGSGWFLSDLDTWHECPAHRGRPHPEFDDPDDDY